MAQQCELLRAALGSVVSNLRYFSKIIKVILKLKIHINIYLLMNSNSSLDHIEIHKKTHCPLSLCSVMGLC